ncbi:DoxX family protein [Mesorhizobium sp. LNHC209A00]|uniref:DoxX family protein n=1 Tax=Mesorhizobium TaxID=68287 RepID=UPI0003D0543B|nr:DoxX family protein [Mesorhizobium sp. LNHC209A00]ESY94327.1 membrane protein [Mesorhizobium sp. LNHC209A00]
MNNAIVLTGRVLLSLIFILSGSEKLTDISGTAAYFGMYNLPAPGALAGVSGLVELVGGLAVLAGFQTRIAAFALAAFCVLTALIAHRDWADVNQLIHFQKNLAMAGGFLLLGVGGAGALSVDSRRSG